MVISAPERVSVRTLKAAAALESYLSCTPLRDAAKAFDEIAGIIQSGMEHPESTTVEVSFASQMGIAVGQQGAAWWQRLVFSTLEGECVTLQIGYPTLPPEQVQAASAGDRTYVALIAEMLRCHMVDWSRGAGAKASRDSILSEAFDAVEEGIVVHFGDGSIAAGNRGAQQILGLTADELAGKTSADPRWEALDEDGRRLDWRRHPAMVTLRTGEVVRDFIMGVRHVDGKRVWIRVNSFPLSLTNDPSGKIGGLVTFHDITQERTNLLRLEVRDTALALIGASLPGIMISLHAPDGTYEHVSEVCRDLLGYHPDEMLGRSSYDFVHPADIKHVLDTHEMVPNQPDRTDVQWRLIRKDGTEVPVQTLCQLVRDVRTQAIRAIACVTWPTGRPMDEQAARAEVATLEP